MSLKYLLIILLFLPFFAQGEDFKIYGLKSKLFKYGYPSDSYLLYNNRKLTLTPGSSSSKPLKIAYLNIQIQQSGAPDPASILYHGMNLYMTGKFAKSQWIDVTSIRNNIPINGKFEFNQTNTTKIFVSIVNSPHFYLTEEGRSYLREFFPGIDARVNLIISGFDSISSEIKAFASNFQNPTVIIANIDQIKRSAIRIQVLLEFYDAIHNRSANRLGQKGPVLKAIVEQIGIEFKWMALNLSRPQNSRYVSGLTEPGNFTASQVKQIKLKLNGVLFDYMVKFDSTDKIALAKSLEFRVSTYLAEEVKFTWQNPQSYLSFLFDKALRGVSSLLADGGQNNVERIGLMTIGEIINYSGNCLDLLRSKKAQLERSRRSH